MKKTEKRLSDYDNSGQLGVTEMIGAIIFMLFGGLKKPYKHYHRVKYQKRNIIVGYLFGIIVFLLIFVFGVIPYLK